MLLAEKSNKWVNSREQQEEEKEERQE